jgi:hypothetical protein
MTYDMNTTPAATDPRILALQSAVDAGRAKGEFALSLLEQYARRGSLSDKQWPWVEKLAAGPRSEALADQASMTAIIAAFDAARQHKGNPVLRILAGEMVLRLAIAGERSRYQGAVNVTSNDRDYERRTWFGRINLDGSFTSSRDTTPAITAALEAFAADPLAAAAAYGKSLHACCFCGIQLTSKASVAAGYGPICAQKWGLAWGAPKRTRKSKSITTEGVAA